MYERGWMKFNSPFPIGITYSHSYARYLHTHSLEIKFLWIRLRDSWYTHLAAYIIFRIYFRKTIYNKNCDIVLYRTTQQ